MYFISMVQTFGTLFEIDKKNSHIRRPFGWAMGVEPKISPYGDSFGYEKTPISGVFLGWAMGVEPQNLPLWGQLLI